MGQTMDVLAAILTCSLYADDALVRAIIDNAHDNPLVIFTLELDPATGSSLSAPETLDAAIAQLREVVAHGERPVIGLMQVPVTWASAFGREAADLFDPCINVSIGTAMLSEFDYMCTQSKSWPGSRRSAQLPTSRRTCALRRYAQAVRMPDLMTVVRLDMRYQGPALSVPTDGPIFPPPHQREGWGSDNLLVPSLPSKGPLSAQRRPAAGL
jgi:hypothetical protein